MESLKRKASTVSYDKDNPGLISTKKKLGILYLLFEVGLVGSWFLENCFYPESYFCCTFSFGYMLIFGILQN